MEPPPHRVDDGGRAGAGIGGRRWAARHRVAELVVVAVVALIVWAPGLSWAKVKKHRKAPAAAAKAGGKKGKSSAEEEEAPEPELPRAAPATTGTQGAEAGPGREVVLPIPRPKGTPSLGAVDVSQFTTGELPIAAQGAIVVDEMTGNVLYAKNADEAFYPASTTKVLTALLVIEAGNLDQEVVVGTEEQKVGESSLNLLPGQRYTRRQLLYGLMLKSANDVAYCLACDNAGSIEAFAEKMNRRAKELGATNSHFMNPHGLHNPQHYTTPHDLGLIARAAMQQPFFHELVGTQYHQWQSATGAEMLRNHNRLLQMYPGCDGVKTGYTYPAQQVLVSAALWGTREVISVVMHTDKPGIWDDSKMLLTYGFLHLPEVRVQ